MIRSSIPIMGTWAFVAYTLYDQPWLIQPVSIFSIFGLGLLVMLVNHALAPAALAAFDRRWHLDSGIPRLDHHHVQRWLAGVGLALVAWTWWLSLALFHAPTTPSPTVTVAAIQVPGRDTDNRGYEQDPGRRGVLFGQLQEQTREAARQGAKIIV